MAAEASAPLAGLAPPRIGGAAEQTAFYLLNKDRKVRKCIVGVCAMDKKTRSKPMTQILDRLRAYGEFDVVVFGNALLEDDSIGVEKWPLCDCLIIFSSSGFPFDKALRYVQLRQPFCVNDLPMQARLKSRPEVYETLRAAGVPTPPFLVVDRSPDKPPPNLVVADDYIMVDGERLDFPLVEKPFNGDDHNVHILYGKGKGTRRLFRKVKDRSSEFFPDECELRTDGSYLYEQFMGGARDLKVYTLGPGYAHGETRKSPTIDGIVQRDPDQKELRLLARLTEEEKKMATAIVVAFKQNICGFDIIRWRGSSYVMDVNGWSFVKGNLRYYDKAARILRKMFLSSEDGATALSIRNPIPSISESSRWFRPADKIDRPRRPSRQPSDRELDVIAPAIGDKAVTERNLSLTGLYVDDRKSSFSADYSPETTPFVDGDNNDVLRGLVAVFRHADRTPKQKIKVISSDFAFLDLFPVIDSSVDEEIRPDDIADPDGKTKAKLKEIRYSAKSSGLSTLESHLPAVIERALKSRDEFWAAHPSPGWTTKKHRAADSLVHKLKNIRSVLAAKARGTKVQLKPIKLQHGRVTEVLLVCKWGGEITHAGLAQTAQYAPVFWDEMLRPGLASAQMRDNAQTINGFLDLEAEYTMHASKDAIFQDPQYLARRAAFVRGIQVYASDEARVRSTAKAFLQHTLRLPEVPPSEAVHTDLRVQAFLDDIPLEAREIMSRAKQELLALVMSDNGLAGGDDSDDDADSHGHFTTDAEPVLVDYPEEEAHLPFGRSPVFGPTAAPHLDVPPLRHSASDLREVGKSMTPWAQRCLRWLGVPKRTLTKLLDLMKALQRQIARQLGELPQGDNDLKPSSTWFAEYAEDDADESSVFQGQDLIYTPDQRICMKETFSLLQARWDTLISEFYNEDTEEFDATKIPDVYDAAKYDALHNSEFLGWECLRPLYRGIKRVADFVIPSEYGLSRQDKAAIGRQVVKPLMEKIIGNLDLGLEEHSESRVFLYFSSESHLHSLRNTLLFSRIPYNNSVANTLESIELNYLAHGVFRLYEDMSKPHHDPLRFYVNVQFSPGAALNPFTSVQEGHLLPISRPVPINGRIPYATFRDIFLNSRLISHASRKNLHVT